MQRGKKANIFLLIIEKIAGMTELRHLWTSMIHNLITEKFSVN